MRKTGSEYNRPKDATGRMEVAAPGVAIFRQPTKNNKQMRLSRLLLAFLLPALLFGACKKDEPKVDLIDFGPSPGFQYRTLNNLPMGGDATDWVADGPWNTREKQLFTSLNLSLDGSQQSGTWYCDVYPNQSEATAGFHFTTSVRSSSSTPAGSRIAYVIVDQSYNELRRGDIAAGTEEGFPPNTLAAGALYRMYFVCYVPGQQVYFRSHGDIKVE